MEAPTYRSLGDHTESFQVEFDPAVLSYERLLDVFWESHDPTARSRSTQYANLLFVHDDAQERTARESAAALEARTGAEVRTEIRRLAAFWPAEDYHQKYSLRGDPRLLALARASAPDETALRESPLAAKLNAFAAGDLGLEDLRARCADLGFEVEGDSFPRAIRPLRVLVPEDRERRPHDGEGQ